ncbi:MAG: class I SAM-dependent methyltransferase [Acidobacteriota bacterium]
MIVWTERLRPPAATAGHRLRSQEAHFDEIAGEYDDSLPTHVVEHYLAKRVAFVSRLLESGSVLDVGCGTGVLASRLVDHGFEVSGVDPSDGMLDRLRERDPRIEARQGSATALPFEDASFDLTMCVAVMHHIAEPEMVRESLAEMVRVTRPGGLVLVWDHNPRNPYWKNLMARVPQDDGSERLVPEAELVAGLVTAGARLVSVRQLGFVPEFVPPGLLGAAGRMERLIEHTPGARRLCAHNVVVARRN